MKKYKKLIITLSILAAIVIVAFIATLPLYTTNSNVDKYTGVKREAALRAIDHDNDFDSPTVGLSSFPAQIVEIKQNTERPCTNDSNNTAFYDVTVRRVGLFGTTYKSTTYHICYMG